MQGVSVTDACGVILAGVHRWGRSPFEQLLPRPLLPVAESPLICYGLRWLRDAGIRHATVCANSESRLVRRCLADGADLDLDIHYYEDMTPRGPAGCARDAAQCDAARDFVVIEGSVIPAMSLAALLKSHRERGAALTIVVEAGPGEDGRPMPRSSGIYVLSRQALEMIPPTGYQDIKELLIPKLYAQGLRVETFRADGRCLRVTNVDTYLMANEWTVERIVRGDLELVGYARTRRACVHRSAVVDPQARLVGPVMIGPEAQVSAAATVVGPTIIGEGSEVGPQAVVCRSVIWDRCRIGRNALVDHCVLATGAQVSDSARLYNALHTLKQGRGRSSAKAVSRWPLKRAPRNGTALGGLVPPRTISGSDLSLGAS